MSENFNAKYAHEYIDKLLKELEVAQEKIKSLSAQLSGGTLMEMKPYKLLERFYSRHYDIKCVTEEEVNRLYQEDLEIIKENEKAAANNAEIYNTLCSIFKNLGFRDTELRLPSPRAYKKVSCTAGWLESIKSIRTSTGAAQVHEYYKTMMARIAEQKKKDEQERVAKQRQIEAEEKKKELLKYIVTLEAKYGDTFSSAYAAKQFLLAKDKYLRLAYYLEKNRGDWSDGADYARTGLREFPIETDTDRQIHDEIADIISDFEDGRSFRDCTWNYSVLYGMADETIRTEFQKLMELEPDRDW